MRHPIAKRTSQDSPLRIAEIPLEAGQGRLGLTLCPGKKDGCKWNRDLAEDLRTIRAWGATTVVTLIEEAEFPILAVEDLGPETQQHGMDWLHLPIRDVDVPDYRFEDAWPVAGPILHQRLDRGQGILIHCRGGLGRTGLVAGLILVERGIAPPDAIERVRAARSHAIETEAQEDCVLGAKRRTAAN